jgi:hypothetical protein
MRQGELEWRSRLRKELAHPQGDLLPSAALRCGSVAGEAGEREGPLHRGQGAMATPTEIKQKG